ncbi:LuxR C-terminal-related transcriptional regulator [Gordonia sp. LSe1-13]|uniref:LuxR C-terminal-related transcriptional regulator n=2 Tax=Gordonia TaxID=2053 RepID=A0ABU7ME38_9ACTN|nr:LuxR C-terminal-related transcriptional regulator [Gordonia sp. LSe1-13]MEE4025393.1 LuxR C-terminal-related transcriptional regulator [Gordonia sp. PKS22-38]
MTNPAVRHHYSPPVLSDREVDVLVRWVADRPMRDIARELFITDATVRTHLVRIRNKYRDAGRPATTKIALLVRAIEDGYTTLNEIAASVDGGLDRQVRLVQQRPPSTGR